MAKKTHFDYVSHEFPLTGFIKLWYLPDANAFVHDTGRHFAVLQMVMMANGVKLIGRHRALVWLQHGRGRGQ